MNLENKKIKEIKTEDYQVTGTNFDEQGNIRSFDINIKGANFKIERVYNNFKPTKIFKFNKSIEFIEKERNGTIAIEIDWDTSLKGMQHLAEQMGLKCIPGIAGVTTLGRQTYFIEEVEA